MGGTGQLLDPLCDPYGFLPAPMPDLFPVLGQVKQTVPLIFKRRFCHIFLYPKLLFPIIFIQSQHLPGSDKSIPGF